MQDTAPYIRVSFVRATALWLCRNVQLLINEREFFSTRSLNDYAIGDVAMCSQSTSPVSCGW